MADISSELNALNTAIRGEDVRDAILSALEKLNTNKTATTLGGHSAEEFVKMADYEKVFPLDAVPTAGSTKGVTSGGVYDAITTVGNYIYESINGNQPSASDSANASIAERLQELANIRRIIRQNIANRGYTGTLSDTSSFTVLAEAITNIPNNANIEASELKVTQNGEYEAEAGHAYNPVKVNVDFSNKLTELNITGSDLPDNPDEQKEFNTDDDDDHIGFSKVTVDVTSKLKALPIEVDASNFGEERTYDAVADDNVYGYRTVTIKIVEDEGPFTVEFYADDSYNRKLETVNNVPKHGNAEYNASGNAPKYEEFAPDGQSFVRWNPSPIDVTRNLKCVAEYKKKESTSYGSDQEIAESWADILQDGGRNVALGDWKTIYYDECYFGNIRIPAGSLIVQKVSKGEAGTNSTWLARGPIGGGALPLPLFTNGKTEKIGDNKGGIWDPEIEGSLAYFLNHEFLSKLQSGTQKEEGEGVNLVSCIKSATKYSCTYTTRGTWRNNSPGGLTLAVGEGFSPNAPTSCQIWIPSCQELGGTGYETAGRNYMVVINEFPINGASAPLSGLCGWTRSNLQYQSTISQIDEQASTKDKDGNYTDIVYKIGGTTQAWIDENVQPRFNIQAPFAPVSGVYMENVMNRVSRYLQAYGGIRVDESDDAYIYLNEQSMYPRKSDNNPWYFGNSPNSHLNSASSSHRQNVVIGFCT